MNFEKIKVKYWVFLENIKNKNKYENVLFFLGLIFLFSFFIFTILFFSHDKSGGEIIEKNNLQEKQAENKNQEIKPGGEKVYMNFNEDVISFYKNGRILEKMNLKNEVEVNECFNFSNKLLNKIIEFSGSKPEIYFSNIGKEKEEKLLNNGDDYCVKGYFSGAPDLSAKSYYVRFLEGKENLFSKNENEIYSIASVTKLMTALVFWEDAFQSDMIKVSNNAFNVATNGAGDLKPGEIIKTGDLVYPLLIESSNVASEVMAEYVGRNKFLKSMNKKADELGLESTNFNDPSGISPRNVSTTHNLYELVKYIYENQRYILNITRLNDYSNGFYFWVNNNKFVGEDWFNGGKFGYTPEAMQTNVGVFDVEIKGLGRKKVIISLLGSLNGSIDIKKIINYIEENIFLSTARKIEHSKDFLDNKIELVFVGDIMMNRGVLNKVNKKAGGDFNFLFENLSFLKEKDIIFGNLEGPVSDKGEDLKNLYSFRMNPKILDTLYEFGFNALSVANNHAGDWGVLAFKDTLNRLEEKNILTVGGGFDKDLSEKVKILEQNGYKIGFLGFSNKGPDWLGALEEEAGVLIYKNEEHAEKLIKKAETLVDLLVVSFHFGEEYQPRPTDTQKRISRNAIDSGAEIVIGHHPHVVQPIEKYKGGIIAYSLGNFIFDQDFSKETMEGLLLEVVFSGEGIIEVKEIKTRQNEYFQPILEM